MSMNRQLSIILVIEGEYKKYIDKYEIQPKTHRFEYNDEILESGTY